MFTMFLTVMYLVGNTYVTQELDIHLAAPSYEACMNSQIDLAKYVGQHPSHKIVKWRCAPVGTEASL